MIPKYNKKLSMYFLQDDYREKRNVALTENGIVPNCKRQIGEDE